MVIVIVGIVIGLAYLIATLYSLKKKKQKLEDIDLSKYTLVDNSKNNIYLLLALLILSIIGITLGIVYKNNENTSLGIMLLFLCLSEILSTKSLHTFYYNNTNIIINGKVIRLKSIKSITQVSKFINKKYELTTLSNDKEMIPEKTAIKIEELRKTKKR